MRVLIGYVVTIENMFSQKTIMIDYAYVEYRIIRPSWSWKRNSI